MHVSASCNWLGPELIGCKHTAVPLQSPDWGFRSWEETGSRAPHPFFLIFPGRGHTQIQDTKVCKGWGIWQLASAPLDPSITGPLLLHAATLVPTFHQGQSPVWPGCKAPITQAGSGNQGEVGKQPIFLSWCKINHQLKLRSLWCLACPPSAAVHWKWGHGHSTTRKSPKGLSNGKLGKSFTIATGSFDSELCFPHSQT